MRVPRLIAGLVLAATLFGVLGVAQQGASAVQCANRVCSYTADPQASAATVALRRTLDNLMAKPASDTHHRLLSGQSVDGTRSAPPYGADPAANIDLGWSEAVTPIKNKSGFTPKVVGFDYSERRPSDIPSIQDVNGFNASRRARQNQLAIAHANSGGYVQISWHATNPWDPTQPATSNRPSGASLRDITNPATAAGAQWKAQADRIAASLQQLQNANVPVLFRPFHEMNGPWFWWGGASTTDFNAIWNHLFDYLTSTKGLHNLLWVFSANQEDGGTASADAYYTNDVTWGSYTSRGTANRVDVLGLDVYSDTSPGGTTFTVAGYDKLATKGKPFGLTEYGPKTQINGAFDQVEVRDVLVYQGAYPDTVFAIAWHDSFGQSNNMTHHMSLGSTANGDQFIWADAVVARESNFAG